MICRWLTMLAVLLLVSGVALQTKLAAEERTGIAPMDGDGQPLNLNLEQGTLAGWQAEGEAFDGQPIEGDSVHARRQDMHSRHEGRFWIGGFERSFDEPQGTLTSQPFKVTHPFASFLVAGGSHAETCVEIVDHESGEVVYRATGDESEELKPVSVDLQGRVGQQIFIRVVDRHSGGWGHINYDDFRFHETRPDYPERIGPPPVDTFQNAGLSPEDAAAAMTVPEGFKVTLFAGEPDVQQPIAFCIDDRGRLWVAEAYSYPFRVEDDVAQDRILIFEDRDGDGKFDSRKVFADKLNLVSGLEVGFGGVWVGAAPEFLFIPDADGDDSPDGPPQVLLDGWGYHDTHETLNAFIWGPDGWLYGCHGVFTHSRVGPPGSRDEDRVPLNAAVWRYHPTWHAFEVFAEGTSNPWGVDFNDQGQAFCTACVIPHLYHMIQGARYQRQAGQHFNPYTYQDIQTIARHRHWIGATPHAGNNRSDAAGGGHAHSGAMIYLGGSWPAEYRNQIFMNNIHGARLNVDRLEPQGSGYAGDRAPDFLLANDSWSQIINLQYGPDGQAYMIDWYDKNQCHHRDANGHDRSNGRIFKISYENATPVQVDLAKLSNEELVELQLHANDWHVRHARRILQERHAAPGVESDVATREALAGLAFEHPDETRRLRGLWALHAIGGLNEAEVSRGLGNDMPLVRAWTIQLAMEQGLASRPTLDRLAELAARDSSPVVRLYLASVAGRLSLDLRWPIVTRLAQHAEDATDHNLPLLIWYAVEPLAERDPVAAAYLAEYSRLELVDRFLVRRLAQHGAAAGLARLIDRLSRAGDLALQRRLLEDMNAGLIGTRRLPMPPGWSDIYPRLLATDDPQLRAQATGLALTFGDAAAFAIVRQLVTDRAAETELRETSLAALVKAQDPELAGMLQGLLDDPALRRPVLRALASADDARTPEVILAAYDRFDADEKRDALATLASRVAYGLELLSAVGDKRVPATDLSAELIRQLRNLKNDDVNLRITDVWGAVNDTPEERLKLMAQYKRMLNSPADQEPDLALGRALYAKTCQQCHVLFGVGGKVGPELTGSNRSNLDYVLANVLDPSALIGKDYQATVIQTIDGRVLTGIVRGEDQNAVTLLTATEMLTLPQADIDARELSAKSMMPDDQWKPLSDHEVRSMVAYLASPAQAPLLLTPDNAAQFFNGRDLTGWQGAGELWSVEEGQIFGRTEGLDHNEFLRSELLAGDFRFSVEVKLSGNAGNSGIQFRSEALEGGEVKGYQADIGAGWWGKLYEEHGRGLLWDHSGESHVLNGDWNRYEIVARGSRVQTWINGQLCVDLDDPEGAKRGIFALQLHSGGATEVRFRDLKLEPLGSEIASETQTN